MKWKLTPAELTDEMTPEEYRASEGADMKEHMDTGGGSVVIAYMVFCIWGSIDAWCRHFGFDRSELEREIA